jgi:FMN phosphatase YigB (HAD superfamily)
MVMSRKGMLAYFSYVFMFLMAPVQAQEIEIDFSSGDAVQFAFDIHDTLTYKDNLAGMLAIGVKGCLGLVRFGYLKYRSSVPEKELNDASVEGIIAADENIRSSEWACQSAKAFADARNFISPEMVAFLIGLSKTYDNKFLSNIGPENLALIQARCTETFNKDVVSGGIYIDYVAKQKLKPHDEPYERFEREYRQTNPKTGLPKIIIFVDDKQRNVDAAAKRPGWIGILFKDLAQLKKDLVALGIKLKPEEEAIPEEQEEVATVTA